MGNSITQADLQKYVLKTDEEIVKQEDLDKLNLIYQTKGNYALSKDLELIYQTRGNYVLNTELANYQPKGDYVLSSSLSSYQPKGDYVVSSSLSDYQPKGDYVLTSKLIDYAKKSDFNSYQTKGNYALKSDLVAYQPKIDYTFAPFKTIDTTTAPIITPNKTFNQCKSMCTMDKGCVAFKFPIKNYNEKKSGECIIHKETNTEQYSNNFHLFYKN